MQAPEWRWRAEPNTFLWVGSYLQDLGGRTLLHHRLAVVPRLTAVLTPATEVSLVLAAPALGTV